MTTKDDVARGFASVGGLIKTIGETIKETQRKKQVEKVLKQFQDPNKLFLNPDGTPKSDSEIAPMLNQGVMSLYQLGEDKLANSLTEYYSTMSKSFDKTSQNAFNYDYKSPSAFFPKGQDGKPIPFDESGRTDYSGVRDPKQYKPDAKKTYKPLVIDEGALGKRVLYYNDEVNEWGNWDEEGNWVKGDNKYQYEKPVNYNVSKITSYNKSDFPAGMVQLSNGVQTQYDPDKGIQYNGKWITPEELSKMGITADYKLGTDTNNNGIDLQSIATSIISKSPALQQMDNADVTKYTKMYAGEIESWLNGGRVPSFMTTDWIQNNSDIYYQLKQLKGK